MESLTVRIAQPPGVNVSLSAPNGSVTSGSGGGLFANLSSTIVAPVNQFRLYIPYLNITWD